jgi:hypothetical protein
MNLLLLHSNKLKAQHMVDYTNSNTPLKQAVGKLNEGVAALANAVASMPDAAARGVSTALHGQETVEKVAGKFDPEPLTTLADRLRSKPTGHSR